LNIFNFLSKLTFIHQNVCRFILLRTINFKGRHKERNWAPRLLRPALLIKLHYWNYSADQSPQILSSSAACWQALLYRFSTQPVPLQWLANSLNISTAHVANDVFIKECTSRR